MKRKNLVITAAALAVLVVLVLLIARPTSADLPWHENYPSALEESQQRDLLLLAFLYTDWCTYCRQMEQTTFQDPGIIERMKDQYIWLRLNAENDPIGAKMRQEFHISSYPTLLILSPDGKEVERLEGYLPPAQFERAVETQVHSPGSLLALRERVNADPDQVQPHYQLAMNLLDREMLEEARVEFRKVTELDSDNTFGMTDLSHYQLAFIAAFQQQREEALARLQILQEQFPQSQARPDALLLEAELRVFRGETARARELLTEYLEVFPDHRLAGKIRQFIARLRSSGPIPAASH